MTSVKLNGKTMFNVAIGGGILERERSVSSFAIRETFEL
jgi:hypothetical protein